MENQVRYDNPHDARMRIESTICRYKNKAVYVLGIGESKAELVYLDAPFSTLKVSYNTPDLDVSSPPVGWANPPEEHWSPSLFLRSAARQQQQGFSLSRTLIFNPRSPRTTSWKRGWIWDSSEEIAFIGSMINDTDWPTVAQAEQTMGKALSREWAIVKYLPKQATFSLFHYDVPVGIYTPKTKTFLFARDMLTKTRRSSLADVIYGVNNSLGGYLIEEQS